jgi:hypothetical protein
MEERLKAELAESNIDACKVVTLILADPSLIDTAFRELASKFARIKFGCAKSLYCKAEAVVPRARSNSSFRRKTPWSASRSAISFC